jgi:DNA mismatch repair protein MutS
MFEPSLSKIGEVGTLLECYYEVHSNKEYEAAILYSFSFHGYVKNMLGLFENLQKGVIGKASFAIDISGLVIKNQYYPALVNESFVTNDANIAKNMVITGPNAAGKTTFLKTTMLNIIFSQQFGCGFYTDCSIHPYTHIHSYLNIPDTSGRDSLFQAESRRCKEIINDVLFTDGSARHFCIFDELYSGTNPAEATKSAYAFLLWLSERKNVDFILTTHYVSICSRFIKSKARIANWKMDAVQDDSGDITYSYKIVKGVSKIQGAIKVLRDMEYPAEILKSIVDYE